MLPRRVPVERRKDPGRLQGVNRYSAERGIAGLIPAVLPAEVAGVVIRRQTVALLVVLGGVVVLAALHHRPRASEGGPEPSYYTPTPAEVAATFAKLRTPRGFSLTSRNCSPHEVCFRLSPSVTLSPAGIDQWLREAGLAPVGARQYVVCGTNHIGHSHFLIMHCGEIPATEGKVATVAYVDSVFAGGAHGSRATTALLGSGRTGYQGTELHVYDLGVPTPETVRAEQAEAREGS